MLRQPVLACNLHQTNVHIEAESDGVKEHVFVWRTQEALSVACVRGSDNVWKNRLQAMAYTGGRCFQEGYNCNRPTDHVG